MMIPTYDNNTFCIQIYLSVLSAILFDTSIGYYISSVFLYNQRSKKSLFLAFISLGIPFIYKYCTYVMLLRVHQVYIHSPTTL